MFNNYSEYYISSDYICISQQQFLLRTEIKKFVVGSSGEILFYSEILIFDMIGDKFFDAVLWKQKLPHNLSFWSLSEVE